MGASEGAIDSNAPPPAATAAPAAARQAAPMRLGWYTVCMTSLVAVMSQVDRGVLALFVQPMKRDFALSDTQVSILLGFAFTFFYVVGGPPLSRIADRGVRRSLIAGCLAVWSLATAFCGLAQNYLSLFIARGIIGGTESGCGPASISMIADAVPREKLPRAYALYNSGFLGGSALSLVIGGTLAGMLAAVPPIHLGGFGTIHNWQLVFIILAAPGLILAAIVRLTVPEPVRRGGIRKGGYPLREVLGFIRTQRGMHGPLLCGILLMNFLITGQIAWMPAFYQRTYGLGPAVIGPVLGLILLCASTIGLFGGARLAEILARKYDDANLRVLFLAQTLPIPLFVIGPLMPNAWLAIAVMTPGYVLQAMGGAGYNAALNLATPNQMRSQINILYFMLQNAIAGSLGPTGIALLTDYVAHSEADLRYVLSGVRLVAGPLCAIFLWRALAPYARIYRQRVAEGL